MRTSLIFPLIFPYADGGGTSHRTEFVYGADNFLIQIRKYDNSILTADTRIVRSGSLALQDRDGANQIAREYTWGADMGGGIGGLLSMRQGAIDYAYLYDGKGNVSAVLDTAQTVAAAYRYDSFGRLQTQAGSLVQPFQYSTKRYFSDTGLLYFGYRYYAPALGKWITRDPIAESGGYNLYAHVLNDPINFVDPLGLRMYRHGYNPKPLGQQVHEFGKLFKPSFGKVDPTALKPGADSTTGSLSFYGAGSTLIITGAAVTKAGAGIIAGGGPAGWIGGSIVTATGIVIWGSGVWTVYQSWNINHSDPCP